MKIKPRLVKLREKEMNSRTSLHVRLPTTFNDHYIKNSIRKMHEIMKRGSCKQNTFPKIRSDTKTFAGKLS